MTGVSDVSFGLTLARHDHAKWTYGILDDKNRREGSAGINGGFSKRMPGHSGMTNVIDVPSVDEYCQKIQTNGGQILEGIL